MSAKLLPLRPSPVAASGMHSGPLVEQLGGGLRDGALQPVPLAGSTPDPRHTDTLICALAMHRARLNADCRNAEFAFLLSLIGWLHGIGPGLRDALRLVHKNPLRFAPLLPRLVELVLRERGLRRSVAEVLEDVLQPARLRLQLVEVRMCLRHSSAFHALRELEKLEAQRGLDWAEDRMVLMTDEAVLRVRDWLHMAASAGG